MALNLDHTHWKPAHFICNALQIDEGVFATQHIAAFEFHTDARMAIYTADEVILKAMFSSLGETWARKGKAR